MNIPFSSLEPEKQLKEIRGLFLILVATTLTLLINILLVQQTTTPDEASLSLTTPLTPSEILPLFTISDVALHNTANDCWISINNSVYNITEYISLGTHPGGTSSLVSSCGTDTTASFERIHSPSATDALAEYLIGTL